MKKRLIYIFTTFICAISIYATTCVLTLPDSICLMEGEQPGFSELTQSVLNVHAEPLDGLITDEETFMTLKAFGMPIKSMSVNVFQDMEVIPWGRTVGVRIDTNGVLVLGTGVVTDTRGTSQNRVEGILKSGDLILRADGKFLNNKEDLQTAVRDSADSMTLVIQRDGKRSETVVYPVTGQSGQKNIGVWVRDSTQGIGTITYYNPKTHKFAALGHGIMDVDTKKLMIIKSGELWPSDIYDIKKGRKGAPGELVGKMQSHLIFGRVKANSSMGIFGVIEMTQDIPKATMKIALQNRVHEGPAKIRSNISGSEINEYDVYIESVNRYSQDSSRGMVLRITDPRLLSKTGGIVQGMSGSPIIQDERLIGAITHVFVQDPSKGYGIFIENMIKQENIS